MFGKSVEEQVKGLEAGVSRRSKEIDALERDVHSLKKEAQESFRPTALTSSYYDKAKELTKTASASPVASDDDDRIFLVGLAGLGVFLLYKLFNPSKPRL